MTLNRIAIATITAAAFALPLGAANAHHIDRDVAKKHVDNHRLHAKQDRVERRRNRDIDAEFFTDLDDSELVRVRVDNRRRVNRRFNLRHEGNVRTPLIRDRIANQRRRIRRARRAGELTFRESRRLNRGLRQIRRALRVARSNGDVSRRERRVIRAMLNENHRRIVRFANNHRKPGRLYRGVGLHLNF